jgi:hypothetical protein
VRAKRTSASVAILSAIGPLPHQERAPVRQGR